MSFVSYDGLDATIQVDMKLTQVATATCKLRQGNRDIVSKNCKLHPFFRYELLLSNCITGISGSFSHIVNEEGNYEFRVEIRDSEDELSSNIIIETRSIQVNFNQS